jgi:ribosome-binding protein aMBF1 (putative translation factor)
MSDLKKYIDKRKKIDPSFEKGFDEGYEQFKIGATLRQMRESAGLTQEELAVKLKTKKRLFREFKTMPRILRFPPLGGRPK